MGETNFTDKQISLHGDNAKEQAAVDKLRQEYPCTIPLYEP